jgi:hypothetical protein
MDIVYVGLLISNIFFIVYCRLMIHHHQHPEEGATRAGFSVVTGFPERKGLDGPGLKYWRHYWLAMGSMIMLVIAGALWRYPHIMAGS